MAYILDDSLGAVGEFKHSNMTIAQFQAQWGPNWVLADGQSIAGSTLAAIQAANGLPNPTLAPNSQALYLRGAGSQVINVGGNNITYTGTHGSTQGCQVQGHKHGTAESAHTHSTSLGANSDVHATYNSTPNIPYRLDSSLATTSSSALTGLAVLSPTNDGANGAPRTGTETRPATLCVNIFVRIN
jgi:hypothetical protein